MLAAKVGVTYQQLQKNEKGVNRVDAARLDRIAAALGVPAAALLDGAPGSRAGEASARHIIGEKYAKRLLVAFASIKDDALRRSLVRFVENVAGRSSSEPCPPSKRSTMGHVLIVRIPRSFSSPHRVIRQNGARFWARSTAGKYEPDVGELRQLFLAAPQLADRIRNFRLDRIAKIAAGDAPVPLKQNTMLVLHIVPFSSFDTLPVLNLQQLSRDYYAFAPIGSRSATSSRVNFDGVLKLSNADEETSPQRSYVQLFHSGIVEAVSSRLLIRDLQVVRNLEDDLTADVRRLLGDLVELNIEPPYALLASLSGVKGARMNLERMPNQPYYDDLGTVFNRDQYHFQEVIFQTAPETLEQAATVLRPVLDQIANAAGQARSRSFHEDGRYIPLQAR